MQHTLSILGSTGSIGTQALEVCRACGFPVTGISAYRNTALLEAQAREFRPRYACVADPDGYRDLKARLADTPTEVVCGMEGLCMLASLPQADTVLNALIGMVGLEPTLAAIQDKKRLALANKETLVAGGELVTHLAKENGVQILPVDSEHSAIFQCLQGSARRIQRILLTASGGPFFGWKKERLEAVTPEQALQHPNWSMGKKITIDSATLMNKGLELIEAVWLFGVQPEAVEIIVHRQSVIHSLVEFEDNSVLGQLGVPDMKIPIQYALTWPDRRPCPVKRLSLTDYAALTFEKPDEETFIPLQVCRQAIERGGLAPCAVNGANEQAVELFLQGRISFLQIGALVSQAMENQPSYKSYTLADVLDCDRAAREFVRARADA